MKSVKLGLPPHRGISWNPKKMESAESGREILPDGRVKYWIRHDILKDVFPKMLVWWFQHLEGKMEYQGKVLERYHVWHPEDHVHVSYEKTNESGNIGPGAVLRIVEYLGRQKRYLVNVISPIEKLDETGFIHNPKLYGILPIARMEYQFQETKEGTFYENCLIVGWKGISFRFLRPVFEFLFFDRKHGQYWIKHNIEEVGQFQNFLPELFRSQNENLR
ncbi:hypothetical protein EHQ96_08200 [Leptospira levettii]|uniref:DAPG hydrolase PhiG domain-containing protein n=1 Tax=Leptospira levettii TaxID=2023178 RepID=A0A5F2ABL1_9LEPT|nr:hypothetical protein [Leptospira levettii]PKA23593.1 hypothetical protein CH381_24995 [Leptospira sp. mixed culture ATI2-C-A1]MCG6147553.1 hypothetical protein [Leptospira levettii]MCW7465166.1 hypothetical protein [Leptospira levettii]MCW7496006.1 hypothetical protein [Leptospira levettii]MCW7509906.1 hypothetical protein [Leptospira levettii]